MDCRSVGFSSPMRDKDSHSSVQVTPSQLQHEGLDIPDYSISECSSSSDQNQRNQDKSLRISGYSSDENVYGAEGSYVNKIYIRTQQNKNKTSMGTKKFRNFGRKNTGSKHRVQRKQKARLTSNLRTRTRKTTGGMIISEADTTPWQKLHSDFTKLRRSKCRSTKLNSSMLIDSNTCVEESSIQSKENDFDISSASSKSDEEISRKINRTMEICVSRTNECNSVCPYYSFKTSETKLRCRKDGYLCQLLRILKEARAERKFLEHDKKHGLRIGFKLLVLKIEASFGVSMATVQLDNGSYGRRLFYVIIDAEMARQVKVGSTLEAYFSESIVPYEIRWKGDAVEEGRSTFVQPHRLLLLK